MKKDKEKNEIKSIDELVILYKNCKEEKKKKLLNFSIIEKGMELVRKIAVSIAAQNKLSAEDLIQVGSLGLIKAIDFYEPIKNAKFSTYATHFIKGEIRHYIRDKASFIRMPRKIQELMSKVNYAIQDLKESGNESPTIEQIAQYVDEPVQKIEEIMDMEKYKSMISLDQAAFSENEDVTLMEKISDTTDDSGERHEIKMLLQEAIDNLPHELKNILKYSFFEELNQNEIAAKMNMTQMQVSRRLKKALNKMYEFIMKD